jgi:hypothetical protein
MLPHLLSRTPDDAIAEIEVTVADTAAPAGHPASQKTELLIEMSTERTA